MASFSTPTVYVNPFGWGPTTLPEQYVGVPFTPFGKGDKIGKSADFVGQQWGRYRNRDRGGDGDFAYRHDDDASFNLVDTFKSKSAPRRGGFRGKWKQYRQNWNQRNRNRDNAPLLKGKAAKYLTTHTRRGKQYQRRNYQYRKQQPQVLRDSSVKVQADWTVIEQFDLSAFTKLAMNPPAATDLCWAGSICAYEESFDRVTTRSSMMLKRCDNVSFGTCTTLDDPVIQQFAESGEGNVFATDELMAHLMACTRSVYPWDLVFTRAENMLFIDEREDSNLEMLTVNETSNNVIEENDKLASYNTKEKLSIEATAINQSFSQQMLRTKDVKKFEMDNPVWDEEDGLPPAPIGYRYRKWKLGDNTLVARTKLHSRKMVKGAEKLMTVYALNEVDSNLTGELDWRTNIDQHRGAVVATALKNNSCKLGKWTAQTLVSGADLMKIGYVSRANPRDPYKHMILGTQFYKPKDFAVQINLSQHNMWGILRALVDMLMKQPAGKYVLLKDPNKPLLRLYSVPMNTFDDDVENESDDADDVNDMPSSTNID